MRIQCSSIRLGTWSRDVKRVFGIAFLNELEDFIATPNITQIQEIGDRCYAMLCRGQV
jgi:hypothetical protein